jgi:hypothetical protein
MLKRLATAGLIPALIVSAALTVAFAAPPGTAKASVSSCSYPYGPSCVCKSATISPTNPVAQAGSTIAFTATATGCANPKFAWWVNYLGHWYLKRVFTTDSHFSLNTAFYRPGHYLVRVWVNQFPSSTHYETFAQAQLTLTGCRAAGITGSSTTSARGVPVTFTAASSGCTNPQFQFYLRDTLGRWHMVQAFSSLATWSTWNNSTSPKGTYYIGVWVNAPGSYMKTRQGWSLVAHTLT